MIALNHQSRPVQLLRTLQSGPAVQRGVSHITALFHRLAEALAEDAAYVVSADGDLCLASRVYSALMSDPLV